MGCTPLCNTVSNVIQRLRSAKARKRKSVKAHPRTEGRIARSVSQGNGSPIYITHAPHDIPNATLAPLPPPARAFPATSETKEIAEFQRPDLDPVIPSSNDTEWSRHGHGHGHESEPGFVTYSSGSPGLSSGHEDGSKRDGFYGEYQYYPTPVREGIYNLTIDSSRLSTIFSDENPNACSIS
ncbi:hypothetical protein ACLOJK_032370 [Asimina triloba]